MQTRNRRRTAAWLAVTAVMLLAAAGLGAYLTAVERSTTVRGEPAAVAAAGLFGSGASADSGDAGDSGSSATAATTATPGTGSEGASGLDSAAHPVAAPVQPNPCAGNSIDQYVRVSITVQHAWLCARNHLVYTTAVTTGMERGGDRTPTGTFHVQSRNTDTTLVPDTGEAYAVKFWIPFDAPAYGFHDASWQHFPYGTAQYRSAGSHGCVHLPLAAMQFLYGWVRVGATVHIER